MNIDRRNFFKVLSAGVVSVTSADKVFARGINRYKRSPEALGILYDATICIGCKTCEVGCKKANHLPADQSLLDKHFGVSRIWDSAADNTSTSYLKIKLFKDKPGARKNSRKLPFSFMRSACMHCVFPDCVSVCPASALTKDAKTGVVQWNEDACIGCRYCQVACPFEIPKFEYNKPFPKIQKCFLCYHRVTKGGIPGCAEFCPTGATLFGKFNDILSEAKRRLQLAEGYEYSFPVHTFDSGYTTPKKVKKYINYIYGEKDGGGTQYIVLSAVPFQNLGLPMLPEHAQAENSEKLQHVLYNKMIAPVTLLAGLMFAAHRSLKNEDENE